MRYNLVHVVIWFDIWYNAVINLYFVLEVRTVAFTDKMSNEVKSEFDRYVAYISQMDGVLQIYLFGSYAYGEPTEYSDIDMLVVVRDDINTLKTMQNISFGLHDMKIGLDVVADNVSNFNERSMPTRSTLQREVKDKGVLVYGDR